MLVYGDRSRVVGTRERLADITRALEAASRAGAAGDRRNAGMRAFILAAELAQGVGDECFKGCGEDAPSSPCQNTLELVRAIAEALFGVGSAAAASARAGALCETDLPPSTSIKTAEGYAFYAVYPQAYWSAAARTQWRAPPMVIGLRSIGTGLAAAVAGAAAANMAISVRPVGHPFRRELRLSASTVELIRGHAGPIAVVDEGPGLSGSSFGAVADTLRNLDVAADRLVFFPSHAGEPGDMASPEHRRLWRSVRREVLTLDDLLEHEPIGARFADLIGAAHVTEDLSAGRWRNDWPTASRPPSWTSRERRKFRLTTQDGRYLARFAGLGASGEATFARARALFAAGFVAEPIALRQGFLLERWIEGTAPREDERPGLVSRLAQYIKFRALALPAASDQGAGPEQLVAMAVENARELRGPALAERIARDLARLKDFSADLRPVQVDGRLHAWEWRRTANGALLKCDAIDHCADHDLVGCQDPMWDVAGAVVEHDFSAAESCHLLRIVSGGPANPRMLTKLAIFKRLYAGFQAGYWVMAAESQSGEDAALCRAQAARYRALIEATTSDES